MKTLIISDTHLGKQFNKEKFEYLKKLFSSSDLVILNGDFWDDSKCTFEEFINSKWNNLFPYLKRKCVYIHGNHDLAKKSDQRVRQFCRKVVNKYELKLPDETILKVVHGHEQSLVSKIVYFFFEDHPKLLFYLLYPIDRLQKFQMYLAKKGFTFVNSINRSYYRQQKGKDYILVTGHTHMPEYNINKRYINTGFVDNNFASYILIEGNNIKLVKEFY